MRGRLVAMQLRLLLKLAAAAAALLSSPAPARADVTIRQRSSARPGYEETLYLKGAMQRREVSAPQKDGRVMRWAFVYDCAGQRVTWLDLVNRRYNVTDGVPVAALAAFNEQQFDARVPPKAKGTLTETVTATDTGERREMFGFAARRLKIVTTWAAAPDACDASLARVEVEGWYVDLLHGVDCSPDLSGATPRWGGVTGNGCLGKRLRRGYFYRRANVGGARLGFPLSETTRAYDERGRVFWTETAEVTELSTAALDAAVFAVPAGYTYVEPGRARDPSVLSRLLSVFRRT